MKTDACAHRSPLDIVPAFYAWSDRTPVHPQLRRVTCPSCNKQWAIDLVDAHRARLRHMRSPGDKRSPYELVPLLLLEEV